MGQYGRPPLATAVLLVVTKNSTFHNFNFKIGTSLNPPY